MVAPAGVNEGCPHEPVKAGLAQAEPSEAEPVKADLAEAVPVQAVLVETGPVEAEAAEGQPGTTELAGTGTAAELAETELAEDLTEGALAEAEPAKGEPAETKPAETKLAERLAEGELAETELAEAELAEGDGREGDAHEERRRVSPLAVAGYVLGIIALVGVAVGVLDVVTHGFRPKTVVTYRPAAVFGLRPGECVNTGPNGLNVTVVSCATPHDAEVFATFSLPASPWPGTAAVQLGAGNECAMRLGGYLDPQLAAADLTQEYVYPNQAAWQAGERTVVCEVRSSSGRLTGSVRAKS